MTGRLPLAIAAAVSLLSCREAPSSADAGAVPAVARPIQAKALVLGLPTYAARPTIDAARPFSDYLTNALGIPVTLRMGEPYDELERWVRDGEVDVAELPPVAWVLLARELPAAVAVATPVIGGSPTYLGHVYVRADSTVQNLEGLRGKSFGYVDHESGSGYLFPRLMLRNKGLDPETFFARSAFYGSHAKVLDAIVSGEIDAGAAADGSLGWGADYDRSNTLRVVAKSPRIPNDCFAARPGYDPGTIEALRRALTGIHPGTPAADAALAAAGVSGWVNVEPRWYERVREALDSEARRAAPIPPGH